jgi:hypothetical protein
VYCDCVIALDRHALVCRPGRGGKEGEESAVLGGGEELTGMLVWGGWF